MCSFYALIYRLSSCKHRRLIAATSIAQEIYTDASECLDSPFWVLVPVAAVQLAEEVFQELRVCIFQNGFSGPPHQIELVVDIVHCQEMGAGSLLCCNVINVGSCDAEPAF